MGRKKKTRESKLNKYQDYIKYIEKLIQQCNEKQVETKTILKKYYDLEYLYPKCQGIVPICTIYEYLESGRCYSLTGPDGAYNLYEQELLMKTIIGKLDDVIDRLDDIAENQRMLANEIRRSHSELSTMLASLDNSAKNMSESLAISEYYNRVTATNTTYLAWVDVLSR